MISPDGAVLSPGWEALALALLHFLWQGAALAGALALLLWGMRGSSAQARYLVSSLTLALMPLSVLLTFLFLYHPRGGEAGQATLSVPPAGTGGEAGFFGARALQLLLWGWWLGVLWMGVRLGGGWVRVRTLVQQSAPCREPALLQALARVQRRLDLLLPVRLVESASVQAPAAVGWWRPVILLPLALAARLPLSSLEAVLAHELAHIRRRDYLINLLQSVIEALLFYHPAVFWVSRRIREEREYCCDDIAVGYLGTPLPYARALAELETIRARALSLGVSSTGGTLMLRIKRLLSPSSPPDAGRGAWLAPSLLAAGALTTLLAAASCTETPLPEEGELSFGEEPALLSAPEERQGAALLSIPWLPEEVGQWSPYFIEASEKHGVDPEMLAIMTLVESGGNPEALSAMGARGLMQIMPGTAASIAAERGLSDYDPARLADPSYNIDMGAWYLARQMEEFEGAAGDPEQMVGLAAAAYNGGPKQLHAHLQGGRTLSEETARYQALVVSLWKERHEPNSPTFEELKKKSRLFTP